MDWITENVALGDMYDAGHLDPRHMDLPGGVNAVLNMAVELPPDPGVIAAHKIMYLFLPVDDGHALPRDIMMKAFVFLARCEMEHKRVLVHCVMGKSRSASMVAMYLALRDNISFKDALQIVRSKRPLVDPAPALARSVDAFVQTYGQKRKDERLLRPQPR